MLWLESYLNCCSIRLAVIVSAIIKALEHVTILIMLLAMGMSEIEPILQDIRTNANMQQINLVKNLLFYLDKNPTQFLLGVEIYLTIYSIACFLAFYGALKLRKWPLMPFIILDGIEIVLHLTAHVLLMIILKNSLRLGELIGATLLGAFIILFLCYNWAAAVSMFQINKLINTKYYQALYCTSSSKTSLNSLKVKQIKVAANRMNEKPPKTDMSQFRQYAWRETKPQPTIKLHAMHSNWLYEELVNNLHKSKIILSKY